MLEQWEKVWPPLRYSLILLPTAILTIPVLPLLVSAVLSIAFAGVGFLLLPLALKGVRRWADWNRERAAALLGESVSPRPMRDTRLRAIWDDPSATARDIMWLLVHVGIGLPIGLVTLVLVGQVLITPIIAPLWWMYPDDAPLRVLVVIPVRDWTSALMFAPLQVIIPGILTVWAVPRLARLHARIGLFTLAPSTAEVMAERVHELTETRAGALDAHAAELRRIERDLHDGTQARLVAIAMQLGVAREALPEDPNAVAALLEQAHEGAEEAMTELREVIRNVYPPILSDRGLPGALSALGVSSAVPVQIDVDDIGRLSAAVEAAAYFVVAEALTNVAKHSQATQVQVRLMRGEDQLLIEVTDDGVGGVDPARGTGIAGINKRIAALDGTLTVSSPPGGPTRVIAELPCAL